ncbi:ATP-binding cassette domain-containing protein [Hyphomonas sp.]|uniref:ABC transporter ATP-binding protein n=1 Tax=Hyphomonas sp. TaxID=87 RepID=UPI0025BC0F56|nr:ATP-binding cassette domain-containing protein [Hyphomonas sp.]
MTTEDASEELPSPPTADQSHLTETPGPIAISVQGVCKAYRIYDKPTRILSEVLLGQTNYREKEILKDITFEIKTGEVVGIIGKNGAGKSTLLKLIAGTLAPSSGQISIKGRVSAILELGTGFNAMYSGRDNVIMSAIMRGMTEQAILAKLDSVVTFAGLEDVIEQPFHTYSSGMQARLAFAAAVAVDADVIIIDEALAAGDTRFTARSLRKVREICESGVTALFVSHQTYHVMQLCTRAIWIDDGRIRMDGPPIEVCRAYEYEMHAAIAQDEGRGGHIAARPAPVEAAATVSNMTEVPKPQSTEVDAIGQQPGRSSAQQRAGSERALASDSNEAPRTETHPTGTDSEASRLNEVGAGAMASRIPESASPQQFGTNEYRITKIEFVDATGRESRDFRFGEAFRLRVHYECTLTEVPAVSCGMAVAFTSADEMQHVMYFNTNYPHSDLEMRHYHEASFRQYRGRTGVVEATIPFLQVKAGDYIVSVGILPNSPDFHQFYEFHYLSYRIRVHANGFTEPSVFYPIVEWTNSKS